MLAFSATGAYLSAADLAAAYKPSSTGTLEHEPDPKYRPRTTCKTLWGDPPPGLCAHIAYWEGSPGGP
eukprot:1871996-Pyramimonas_sp.AAC.1